MFAYHVISIYVFIKWTTFFTATVYIYILTRHNVKSLNAFFDTRFFHNMHVINNQLATCLLTTCNGPCRQQVVTSHANAP